MGQVKLISCAFLGILGSWQNFSTSVTFHLSLFFFACAILIGVGEHEWIFLKISSYTVFYSWVSKFKSSHLTHNPGLNKGAHCIPLCTPISILVFQLSFFQFAELCAFFLISQISLFFKKKVLKMKLPCLN